jgi:hypothetical protein
VASACPVALRLDIGLPETIPLYHSFDLDNYLFPLVPQLMKRSGRELASVWATKRHAERSSVAVGPVHWVDDPQGTHVFDVTTSASTSSSAYKKQIRDQAAWARPLPGDALALQLAFVVGPQRAWPNLWKPTIDALGSILGHDHAAPEWNVRDGRITELGLHCTVDPAAGHEVRIGIRASTVRPA